jgi:RNA polymerase sigma-70 factor (ECF subfamily)
VTETTTAAADRKVAELYAAYGPLVYRRCTRLLQNAEAARDATQEVFLKLVRNMVKLDSRETVVPWMYRVATNHCLNERRAARPHADADALPEELPLPVSAHDTYPDRALVQSVLSRFDVATQTIAVAVIVDGLQHEEVAKALGVSRRAVERKLARFLEGAREFVAESAA